MCKKLRDNNKSLKREDKRRRESDLREFRKRKELPSLDRDKRRLKESESKRLSMRDKLRSRELTRKELILNTSSRISNNMLWSFKLSNLRKLPRSFRFNTKSLKLKLNNQPSLIDSPINLSTKRKRPSSINP